MEGQIQQIVCPVCMTVFRRPATLPCGHTFCYACIITATRQHRNCPICRQHIASTPAKMRTDHTLTSFLDSLKRATKPPDRQRPENTHIECKEERLLLVDIVTEQLLLPYNRIGATFELQSNVLIDRMERFVARQEIPYNKLAVVTHLVHVQPIRRNLYRAVLEGRGFCRIESEGVESEQSLEADEEQFFYRTCLCKQISETSDSNPEEYAQLLGCFSRLPNEVRGQMHQKVDAGVFAARNDPVALFYSVLGVINMDNKLKYELAVNFDEDRRLQQIRKFIEQRKLQIEREPSSIVRIVHSQSSTDKRLLLIVLVLMLVFWISRQKSDGIEL